MSHLVKLKNSSPLGPNLESACFSFDTLEYLIHVTTHFTSLSHLLLISSTSLAIMNEPGSKKNCRPVQVQPKKKKRRSKKDIAREIACHASCIKKTNLKANFRREMALLSAINELQFSDDIVVQSRDDAIVM